MALYRDIANGRPRRFLLGAGVVGSYYSKLSPQIFEAYVNLYGMTEYQAETYRLHGPMDKDHVNRALDVLEEAISINGWSNIKSSVRDAFVATSLHYDGMLQAALKQITYWNGEDS